MTEEQQHESGDEDVVEAPDAASLEDAESVEQPVGDGAEPADETAIATDEPAATGHPAVDEVLRSLDALGDAPVDDHVAVFEQAHEQLRRTLQGAGDE